jgi:hypothetical protein
MEELKPTQDSKEREPLGEKRATSEDRDKEDLPSFIIL